jgi:hypothetical protein
MPSIAARDISIGVKKANAVTKVTQCSGANENHELSKIL